jgi:hypothetical protein
MNLYLLIAEYELYQHDRRDHAANFTVGVFSSYQKAKKVAREITPRIRWDDEYGDMMRCEGEPTAQLHVEVNEEETIVVTRWLIEPLKLNRADSWWWALRKIGKARDRVE